MNLSLQPIEIDIIVIQRLRKHISWSLPPVAIDVDEICTIKTPLVPTQLLIVLQKKLQE